VNSQNYCPELLLSYGNCRAMMGKGVQGTDLTQKATRTETPFSSSVAAASYRYVEVPDCKAG